MRLTLSRPTQWLQALREHLAMVLGLGPFPPRCARAWSPIALVLHSRAAAALGQAVGRRVATACFRFYLGALRAACGCRFDLDALGWPGRAWPR